MKNKKYEYHEIAGSYPMMSKTEFSNLVGSVEDYGYDEKFPILIYEGKILDGRNRYEASIEAKVKPIIEEFKGTFEQAVEKSRQLNSIRRNIDKSQKAMVAAKEVLLTRDSKGKNLTIRKACFLNDVSQSYIKMAIKIIDADSSIAQSVFNGSMNIREAMYRIEQIDALRMPSVEVTHNFDDTTKNPQIQEIVQEFNDDSEVAANRIVKLQDGYKSIKEKLDFYRKNCDKHPA